MSERQVTERGFRIFGKRERLDDEVLYGTPGEVTVVESSIAGRGAHVRIYGPRDEHIQINVAEAKMIAEALATFVTEAEADMLTEPATNGGHDD